MNRTVADLFESTRKRRIKFQFVGRCVVCGHASTGTKIDRSKILVGVCDKHAPLVG